MTSSPLPSQDRPARRTQAERSAATQARVLEAAAEVLLESGYSGLTTTRVAQRAGVSRGAQLHQYPTKEALVVAAVDHVARCWGEALRVQAGTLPAGDDRLLRVHELLWSALSGPLFLTALELWVAGRTDPVLREAVLPFERSFVRGARSLMFEMYGPELAARPRCREAIDLVMHTMRGGALALVLRPERPALLDLRLLTDLVVRLLEDEQPAAQSA
ncbi:MAG TPA: TetR/AcrR family transcriptional regulator [Candidatus Dormibacteraeota bacterium]|nr:TetR/AcrR family transcriptional regulator [Candidatus Dormibacteraeota bacterium]